MINGGNGGAYLRIYDGFVRLTPKTEQNKTPNKCGYKARSASGLTSNTQGAAAPIIKRKAAQLVYILQLFNRQRLFIIKQNIYFYKIP